MSVLFDRLDLGYSGVISRHTDVIISNRENTGATGVIFGDLMALKPDNTVELYDGSNNFLGVAVANVKQNRFINQNIGQYEVGEAVDVMERGSIMVFFDGGAATAGGQAYVKMVDGRPVVTATTGTAIPNAVFTTGYTDGEVIEITLKVRN